MEGAQRAADIWSIIQQEKNAPGVKVANDATAIFCGGKGSGKSTLIDKFTNPESSKPPKPTAALEYKSARKDMKNGEYKTVHLWELGGGSQLCSLLECALKKETFAGTVCIVVVDLSKPDEIVSIARFWFQQFKERAHQVLTELQGLGEDAASSNLDRDTGSPQCCGLPVYLLAHKCSVLKQAEPVIQKTVAKTLRALAVEMGATLLYTDIEKTKENQSIQIFRKKLNHDVFGTEPMQVFITDLARTLAISAGSDSIDKINGGDGSLSSADWAARLSQCCGEKAIDQIDGKASVLELSQYEEPTVDSTREQKDRDLVQYRKKCEADARNEAALLGENREEDQNRRRAVAGRRRE
eukprot:TRINITY_DN4132_c0_g1_i1.p1 TRINITY_DN4132_c0_g1~~TRINITY_DN4132_c0_g1_i1.p1  ORF type:complete len:354 (-),score=86.39 TRINITY_DN4132_c0_g1_i1:266-1327(-)